MSTREVKSILHRIEVPHIRSPINKPTFLVERVWLGLMSLPNVGSIAFPCFRLYQRISPFRNGFRYLCLFAGIHVVGAYNHYGIQATGATRLTLNAGFEQFQICFTSNISFRAEKREKRTADASDGWVCDLDSEKIFVFQRTVGDIEER